jgi:hypothetical protein
LITPKILEGLLLCPNLEKLFLSHLTWSEFVPPSDLPKSRFWNFEIPGQLSSTDTTPWMNFKTLVLKNLRNLHSLSLPFPGLESLHIFDCPNLVKISVDTDLQNLRSYTGLYSKFLEKCPNLEKLVLYSMLFSTSLSSIHLFFISLT